MIPEDDIEQEDETPLVEDTRSDTLDSRDLDETLPYSQGVPISNPLVNADLDETLPYVHRVPSPNMNSDLNQTLPYYQGQPSSDNAQTTELAPTLDLLQGEVFPIVLISSQHSQGYGCRCQGCQRMSMIVNGSKFCKIPQSLG